MNFSDRELWSLRVKKVSLRYLLLSSMLVVVTALGVIYRRRPMPEGYEIRGAKIEPPKKRSKKEKEDAKSTEGTGRSDQGTAPQVIEHRFHILPLPFDPASNSRMTTPLISL